MSEDTERPLEEMLLEISERLETMARERTADGSLEEEAYLPTLLKIGHMVNMGKSLIESLQPEHS